MAGLRPILQDSLGYLVKLCHKEEEKEEEVKEEAEAGREEIIQVFNVSQKFQKPHQRNEISFQNRNWHGQI